MEKTIKDLDVYISDGNYSSKYPRSEEFVEEGIPFIRGNNMVDGDISDDEMYYITPEKHAILLKGHVKAGDVLITTRGNIGQVAIVPERHEDSNINAQIVLLRSNSESLYNRYLLWALQSRRANEQYIALQTGTALKQLPVGKLEKLSIRVADIDKQHDIANTLDKVYEVIKERRKELLLLDELIKARFVELFGNPEQNEKGWRTCRLGDECTVINGRAYKAEELLDEGKYRVLRVGNFFTNDSWYYSDLELDNDKYCDEGDLLFAWSASFGPRIWHGEKVIYHYHIWKLIGYENCLNKDFFVELLNYNCDVMKRGTHGSTMLHFTKSQMEDQLLILPPMQLQEQFAAFVQQVDKSKVVFQKSLIEYGNFIMLIYHTLG